MPGPFAFRIRFGATSELFEFSKILRGKSLVQFGAGASPLRVSLCTGFLLWDGGVGLGGGGVLRGECDFVRDRC